LDPDKNDQIEAAGSLRRASLVPGPDGGYRGVETDESTEDEPGLWLTLEDHDRGGTAPAKIRFADGIYAAVAPASRMGTALLALIGEGGVVDLDLGPADDAALAVVSRDGGVGELVSIDAGGTQRSVSRALNGAVVATIALRDAPFTPMGTRSGTAELSSAFQPSSGRPIGILVGLVLLALALGIWLRRRARRRSPTRR
jgi:hypothetical protein